MKQRSEILTAWIALLIIYNGIQALNGVAISVVSASVYQTLESADISEEYDGGVETDEDENDERVDSLEMSMSVVSNVMFWHIADVIARLGVVASLVGMLLWKRLAVWCYCGTVFLLLLFQFFPGATWGDVAVELVGPVILAGLVYVAEPAVWPQFE